MLNFGGVYSFSHTHGSGKLPYIYINERKRILEGPNVPCFPRSLEIPNLETIIFSDKPGTPNNHFFMVVSTGGFQVIT